MPSVKCVASAFAWLLVPPPNGELARRQSSVTSFQPPHPNHHTQPPPSHPPTHPFLFHYVFSCPLYQDKSTGALIHTAHYNFESRDFKRGRKMSSNISITSYGRLLRSPSGWSHAVLPVPTREVEFFWGVGRGEVVWEGALIRFTCLSPLRGLCLGSLLWRNWVEILPKNDRLMFVLHVQSPAENILCDI